MTCHEAKQFLDAYVDRELDVARSVEIDDHVRHCESCASSLAATAALTGAFRGADLYRRAPAALRGKISDSILGGDAGTSRPAMKLRLPWFMLGGVVAGTVAALIVLALTGWMFNRPNDVLVMRDVYAAHIRSLMPGHLTDVISTDQHTVKPWFDGRIDFAPSVRDFPDAGFNLMGGRLDYIADRPAAALVYKRGKHLINLFIWPQHDLEDRAPVESTRDGYHMIRWRNAGMSYCLVSDVSAPELSDLATLLQSEAVPSTEPLSSKPASRP